MRKIMLLVLMIGVLAMAGWTECSTATPDQAKSSGKNPEGGITTVGCDGSTCIAYIFDSNDGLACTSLVPTTTYRPSGFDVNTLSCNNLPAGQAPS